MVELEEKTICISSHEIFMTYVGYKDGKVDVSGIFSVACFKHWLRTRKRKLQYPQQYFQKILYSHIRGSDKRKPFPPYVETALLQVLRNSNPWVVILKSLGKQAKKRSFNKFGFHEQATYRQLAIREHKPSLLELNDTTYDKFFRVMESCLSEKHLETVLEAASIRGYHLKTPAMQFMVNLETDPGDFRFDPGFFSVDTLSAYFLERQPIGTMVLAEDWTVEYMDETAIEIFGGNITGEHMFAVHPCLASVMFSQLHWVPNLVSKTKFWARNAFFAPNGNFDVVIAENILLPINGVGFKSIHRMQKVTHLFPNLSKHSQHTPFLLS